MRGLSLWLERRRSRTRRRFTADHDPGSSIEPRFGYGVGDRPLWSQRDWAAEEIRNVLRDARCVEWSGVPPYHDGFVVEGGGDGEPFAVACTLDELPDARTELQRYTEALKLHGYHVHLDPDDAKSLEVWPPTDR